MRKLFERPDIYQALKFVPNAKRSLSRSLNGRSQSRYRELTGRFWGLSNTFLRSKKTREDRSIVRIVYPLIEFLSLSHEMTEAQMSFP